MELSLERIRRKVSETPLGAFVSVERSAESWNGSETPTEQHDPELEGVLGDYDPSNLCSQRGFLFELGVTPDVFFRNLIEYNGGSLPQKEFGTYTNLSSSTISRLLGEMEDDGQIVRVKVGREKLVFIPEHAPSDGFPSDDADGPPLERVD
ncbi:helix-turn-helix transcriptional regulator [Halorarum salinum]|uniref:DUF7343 domain-containing protein n=1 Tax=Halorarum salinum TaxID=2743089 RepID=A0A7D5LC80_9EURY|nr:hypothetical protein [Halobaculum salinum]QLG63292.1 hypothetical protein HUG12_16760 [Halobaculum salinum]